jgi:hypothetical protein
MSNRQVTRWCQSQALPTSKIVKIGSLKEVEIGTNTQLNSLYIADQREEIQFLQWTTRIMQSILSQDIDERQQLQPYPSIIQCKSRKIKLQTQITGSSIEQNKY